jgi:hypothetical protein
LILAILAILQGLHPRRTGLSVCLLAIQGTTPEWCDDQFLHSLEEAALGFAGFAGVVWVVWVIMHHQHDERVRRMAQREGEAAWPHTAQPSRPRSRHKHNNSSCNYGPSWHALLLDKTILLSSPCVSFGAVSFRMLCRCPAVVFAQNPFSNGCSAQHGAQLFQIEGTAPQPPTTKKELWVASSHTLYFKSSSHDI